MNVKKKFISATFNPQLWLPPLVMGLFLILVAQYNFLVFHTLAELFAVVIAFALFAFGWATRDIKKDNFLLFLACGYLWIGSLDLIHTLAYQGINIFTKGSGNLSTQFWIGTRYLEALLLLGAPFQTKQVQNGYLLMALFGAIAVALIATISLGLFPVSYIEGEGLTDFKIYSEYLIIFILALALIALYRRGRGIATEQKKLMAASIVMTMCAELAFTLYVSVYGLTNLAGHIFKLFSYWFIFQAVVLVNLKKPFLEFQRLQEYNRSLFEDSVTGMALCKEDGTFVDVNLAFARLTGYTVDELKSGMSFWALTPELHVEREKFVVENFARTGKLGPFEKEYLRKDGSLIPVRISGKSVIHDGETFNLASVEDISEYVKGNKTSAELEFQKKALDEHAIVSIADAKGNITYVNDKFCEISGYSCEELLGENHRIIKSDEHSAVFYSDLWQTIRSGKTWRGEMKNRKKGGGYFWFLVTIVPSLDERGRPIRYIAIRSDITERKNAERSSGEFKTTLDLSNDAIHMFWPDTLEYFYVNQTALDMADLKEDEFIGSTPAQFNPNFDEEVFRERSAPLVLGKEKSAIYELDYVNRNGKQTTLEVFLQFMKPENGKSRFVSIARDITERKVVEREINRFKTTLDLAADEVAMFWSDTLELFYVNQVVVEMSGTVVETLYGSTPEVFNPRFDKARFRELTKPLIYGTNEFITFETTFVEHTGRLMPREILLQLAETEGERPYFVAIARDISERKEAEKSIRLFKTTLDLTEDEVYMFWPDTLKFFYVNQAAMNKLGWTYEELTNMTPLDIKPKFGESDFRILLKPLILGKQKSFTFETVHQTHNGEVLPVEINLQYLKPIDEKPRFVAIVQDITERQKVDKAKSEFISTVSHELRTPLTSIKGALGLIRGGALGEISERAQSVLDIAYSNSEQLASLINDILDLDSLEAGKMSFSMRPLNISALLEKAIEANMGYGEEHGVTFASFGTGTPVFVQGDEHRLMQVMANLLSNAAKFSPRCGVVEVSLTRRDGEIRFSVKDYGSGIPEEVQETIFERFTQADSSDQRQKGGTGLGLSIVKMIVEEHGGRVGFTTTEGKGTSFFVNLSEIEERSL